MQTTRSVILCALPLAAVLIAACGREPDSTSGQKTASAPAAAQPIQLAIPAKFDEAGIFGDGLAPVRAGGKFGYADTTGNVVITPQFDFAAKFSEGLAAAGVNNKEGYIDKSGNFV